MFTFGDGFGTVRLGICERANFLSDSIGVFGGGEMGSWKLPGMGEIGNEWSDELKEC